MKLKLFFLFLGILIGVIFVSFYPSFQSTEAKRNNLLTGMTMAIDEMVKDGNYRCCIEPACTMCYMGNWLWKDGICRCDDMIAKGEDSKVCPQCVKGLKEGKCKYSEESKCEI